MQEVFEKIIEKLQKESVFLVTQEGFGANCVPIGTIEKIVKQTTAEYNNGWIPCSERLPEVGERVLLQDFGGCITLEKCEKEKRVKGFTDGDWWSSANNYIAWMPLPEPYQPKGE